MIRVLKDGSIQVGVLPDLETSPKAEEPKDEPMAEPKAEPKKKRKSNK